MSVPLHGRVGRRVAIVALFSLVTACSSASTPPPSGGSGATSPVDSDPADPPGNGSSSGTTPGDTTPPAGGIPTPSAWGAAACPKAGANVGFGVGQTIADLGVKDCATGAAATIDEVCGASATWIFAAHTHCPTCQATAGFTDEVAAAVAPKNVAIVHVVHDDNGTSCEKWRAAYKLAGLGNVKVYADPEGAVWSKLKTSNYTAPSAFLDKNRVVTYREHGLSKSDVLAEIDKALAKP